MVTDKDLRFGDRVLWEDRLYSSKSSQSAHEPPNDTYWTEIEMWTVWRDYIKPHLIWQSAANFAPYAEVRTAQEGIRRVITDYNEPLSREEQAAYQNNLQANADKYFWPLINTWMIIPMLLTAQPTQAQGRYCHFQNLAQRLDWYDLHC